MSPDEQQRLIDLTEALKNKKKFNGLSRFKPYQWQGKICNSVANQILAMCANRTGKTYTGAHFMACHLTGLYPEWWTGRRFKRPVRAWVIGSTTVTTRDILQAELLGDPLVPDDLGTAAIPKDCIDKTNRKPQIPNALESVSVKWHDEQGRYKGHSTLYFKSYEMGEEKLMGATLDVIWADEQPKQSIYTQLLTRTATTGGVFLMTFTPEQGMTPLIHQFMNDIGPGQELVQATWDDALHLDEDTKAQILRQYPENERKMRTMGIPVFGRGLVFPFSTDEVSCEPFDIPPHWKRVCGIDFGADHPTAVTWLATDPDTDKCYIYDEHKMVEKNPVVHAGAINSRPINPPIAWPHDGNRTFDGGESLSVQYANNGCNMMPEHWTNPPAPGQNKGDIKRSVGILALTQAFADNTLKIFTTCPDHLSELATYHYNDEGKIVDLQDDLMSSMRYAYQSRRYATVPKSSFNHKFMQRKVNTSWVV